MNTLIARWLKLRKDQYGETLAPEVIAAYLRFLEHEPDASAVVEFACNVPHNARKSLVPVDDEGRRILLAVKPRKERYAVRTHRGQRTDRANNTPDLVWDTVYKPRTELKNYLD